MYNRFLYKIYKKNKFIFIFFIFHINKFLKRLLWAWLCCYIVTSRIFLSASTSCIRCYGTPTSSPKVTPLIPKAATPCRAATSLPNVGIFVASLLMWPTKGATWSSRQETLSDLLLSPTDYTPHRDRFPVTCRRTFNIRPHVDLRYAQKMWNIISCLSIWTNARWRWLLTLLKIHQNKKSIPSWSPC